MKSLNLALAYTLLLGPAAYANPVAKRAVPSLAGFSLTWSDDFTGSGLPNGANWIMDTGRGYGGGPVNWGTGEVESYTMSTNNLHVANGVLGITALRDNSASGGWTSGRIETQRTDFGARAGGKMVVQASIAMPSFTGAAAAGYWPAFWMLGSAFRGNFNNWPMIGEFDIMEDVNGLNEVFGTLHCGSPSGGPCQETNGLGGSISCPNSVCTGNFHTYTLTVDRSSNPEALRWSVDGVQYKVVTANDVNNAADWNAAVHGTSFILLDLAIGGGFPNALAGTGTPTGSTQSGGTMQVDYVAVYNN